MFGRVVLVCSLAGVGGHACIINTDFDGSGFLCSDDGPCPPGFSCRAGRCLRPIDADIDADPNTPDATPDARFMADARITFDGNPACDVAGTVGPIDDFEDGDATPQWSVATTGPALAIEASGVVTLEPKANAIETTSAAYSSDSNFTIAGGRLFVEVVDATNETTDAFTRLRYGNGSAFVEIEQQAGTITARTKDGTLGSAPYDPALHAWWQLRESVGTVFGEVSVDGATWVILGSGPSPAFNNPRAILSAGTGASTATPGAAQFDNFNRCP